MGKTILEQMDVFIQEVTPESFEEDCKVFGIILNETEDKQTSSTDINSL